MIKDIIESVVDDMSVFDTVEILRGVKTTYQLDGIIGIMLNYIYLDTAEGDVTSDINVGDKVWPQNGTWNYPPTVAAIRTVAAVDFVSGAGSYVTRIDVTIYPELSDNTQIAVIDLTAGYYSVTLKSSDIQYWHVGARMKFKDGGVYYYGTVSSISSPTIIVLLDNLDDLSSITEFAMDINYKHGHPVDVFDQLGRMTVSKSLKRRLYPLIALMEDIETDNEGGMNTSAIQIIIGTHTEAKYTAAERYTYSFDAKRLTKIYERFVQYLRYNRNSYFKLSDHSKFYRLYWGKKGALGNEDNKAYDLIDAIELNIELKTFENC